jgi:ABC-type glutathione transport system ATPase component
LIGDPKILVCDEIVSALDVETQARILQLLIRLQTDRGLSTLFISHDMNVVGALAHRIAVLKQGRLVEIGEAGIILAGGEHSYTRELVACAFAGNPKSAEPKYGEPAVSLEHGA